MTKALVIVLTFSAILFSCSDNNRNPKETEQQNETPEVLGIKQNFCKPNLL
jgi:hypothetical protein